MAIERIRPLEGEPSIAIRCEECNKTVVATNVVSHRGWDGPMSHESGGGIPALYVLYECSCCSSIFLALYHQGGPDNAEDEANWDTPRRDLYPALRERLSASIPSVVREPFQEACDGFECGTYTACVLMCRKTLSGLCHAHTCKKPNLAESLAEMKNRKFIDARLYEWADELRLAGNEAAHDEEQSVSRENASDILEFSRAILEYTYTYRNRFRDFLIRRGKLDPDYGF